MAKKSDEKAVEIMEIRKGRMDVAILGVTPLITEAMSVKVKTGLLCPQGKKTAAEKASNLKHKPIDEFRGSMYTTNDGPTLVYIPAVSFKRAMASAALDIPGASKAQIARSIWVPQDKCSLYGIPKLRMDVVRCADMARTPDIRTRACFAEWACYLTLTFPVPLLREAQVANMLAAAGMMRGVGGFRSEKGGGDYGQFELVAPDDERFARVVSVGGRVAQQSAYASPDAWDHETIELLSCWDDYASGRGFGRIVE